MISRAFVLCTIAAVALAALPVMEEENPHRRALRLIEKMTLEEKISMLHGADGPYVGNIAAIERLGIPAITMNDGPQGFRADDKHPGTSTAFPSGLNIAATFDPSLAQVWGDAMGQEFQLKGSNVQLGPGMNVARIPRNGRNFEYLSGEDPYLGAHMAAAAVQGIQRNGVIANAKHYINNNEETNRMNVSEDLDERTEMEIYMGPFEGAVRGGVLSIMCSYNRINGVWACENNETLNKDLKGRLGFQGWVMSDWGATHSTVLAAKSGLDQQMPDDSFFGAALLKAVQSGEIEERLIDEKVERILSALYAVGAMDRPATGDINANVTSPLRAGIARDLAARSTVILKNEKDILPLDHNKLPKGVAVLGSAAKDAPIVAGGGSGHVDAPYIITGYEGIRERLDGTAAGPVVYKPTDSIADAVAAAKAADVAIVFVATSSGEGWDRHNLSLPANEDALVAAVAAAQPNTIVVVTSPGHILMPWAGQVAGIAICFMPGQEAGHGIADILFNVVTPTAHLPLTMPNIENEMEMTQAQYPGLPAAQPLHAEYSEKLLVGYRWYNAKGVKPLFCFGHGLTYTTFDYSDLTVTHFAEEVIVKVGVKNTGHNGVYDIPQLYLTFPDSAGEPPRQLKGLRPTVPIWPGEEAEAIFALSPRDFSVWDETSHAWRYLANEEFVVEVGRSSCDLRSKTTIKTARHH